MINIEIDDKPLTVAEGTTIIEAADAAGIYIPRFCYHRKLSIAANCRMCLVQVEKSRKPLPACATPVTSGMKIYTRSNLALQAQRSVMEFLLINHPLDCPICDQGGECELQDLSMGFGRADSEYTSEKRSVASDNIGPLIETWMTRCIHCTRCVRFGEEIAGLREMGMTFRGEHAEIGTYIQHFLRSELSGNIIDICPVGALTNKPARYSGRSWEYREHPSIAPHDAVGGHVFVHSRGDALLAQRKIMRAVPRECDAINETWMSDRDRYSVHGLYHQDRVYKPRINVNGEWREVSWQRALDEIADRVAAIVSQQGADQLAALASPSATLEELFLLQKMLRALGSNNIDHRQREHDFSDQQDFPLFPGLNMSLPDVEALSAVLLVGCHLRVEQPLLAHRVNKAFAEGAVIMALNAVDYRFAFDVRDKIIVTPAQWVNRLAQIARALADLSNQSITELSDIVPDDAAKAIAATLQQQKNSAIFLGEQAMQHHQAAALRRLAHVIATLSGASVSLLTAGANTAGAWLAGAVPHREMAGKIPQQVGKNAKALLSSDPVRAYFLLNTEPEFDSAYPQQAIDVLQQAGLVVCLTPFVSESMKEYAHFILPIAPFTENAGTFVNMEGRWQYANAASVPHQDARPGWKVLRVLANFLALEGFDYKTEHDVQQALQAALPTAQQEPQNTAQQNQATVLSPLPQQCSAGGTEGLSRLAPWLMYRSDSLVRRSAPLQASIDADDKKIGLSPATAARYQLSNGGLVTAIQGQTRVTLPLLIQPRLADDTVLLPAGLSETMMFGDGELAIQIERGQA